MEKLKLEIQSIEETVDKRIGKIKSKLDELFKDLSSLENNKNSISKIYEDNKSKNENLLNNNEKMKSEDNELKSRIESLNKEITENENTLNELTNQRNSLDTEFSNTEQLEKETSSSITELENKLSKIKSDLINSEKEYEEKVKSIENEIEETKTNVVTKENQFKILKMILNEGYIKDPVYDVCKVIKQKGINNLNQLIQSSAVSPDIVKQTLIAMNDLELVDYNQSSGNYTLLKDYEI